MNEMTEEFFNACKEDMQKAIDHLQSEYQMIRAGRANPHILDKVIVEYYGVPTPINQMANISVPEARVLLVNVWDQSQIVNISKAISQADLGVNPIDDGKCIRLIFPALTEERRKEYAKNVWKFAEHAKVAIRNIRRDANDEIKKCDGSEDEIKDGQNRVQKLTDKFVKEVDEIGKVKEKDIMTV